MKVNFIIAGFQKCGTTALHSFLSSHPKVIASSPKELDYFNYKLNYERGIRYYHSFFKEKPLFGNLRGYRFFESSPSYLNDGDTKETAKRIYRYNAEMKIIGIVRDPVARAYSAWNMYRERFLTGDKDWWITWVESRKGKTVNTKRRHKDEFFSFELYIQNEMECLDKNQEIECPILKLGKYHNGIGDFIKIFGDNVLIIKNEDLTKQTAVELDKISNYLDIPSNDWQNFEDIKIFEGKYNTSLTQKTEALLKSYYKKDNELLFNLTEIKY